MSKLVCEIGLSQMYGATNLKEVRGFFNEVEIMALTNGVLKINTSEFSIPGNNWGEPASEEVVKLWGVNA